MKPYYQDSHCTIYNCDCRDVLPSLPKVDTVITDPPYGLRFMGKRWDYQVPTVEQWLAVLGAAKPGAMLLSFGGTRTYHRVVVNIEDAGWEIRDCVMWLYGSGFPKSLDISKAIDKVAGRIGQSVVAIKREIRARYESQGMTLKDFNAACGFEASGYLRESSTWATVLPPSDKWKTIKSILRCGGGLDSLFAEAEREILTTKHDSGKRTVTILRDEPTDYNITAPSTEAAKEWDGWGTALKPAYEPIAMAMKRSREHSPRTPCGMVLRG